jgi:hypothetical protein
MGKRKLICTFCDKEIGSKEVSFEYFDHRLERKIPCCESCGQCYVSKPFARGKIRNVEIEMEDK